VVALARDVTEEHAAQARVVRAERLAAVGELAGQVAHEVNNPIAIISAKARLLLRDGHDVLPPKAAQEIGKIAELADRVARIAQGLLSYCRPAPGARVPLDVRLPIRRALAYVEARARGDGVLIHDELPERLPPLYANAAELEQVFLNLFLNALDAMPGGGRLRVSATIGATLPPGALRAASADGGDRTAEALTVSVGDTGAGIPPGILTRVFEPFLTTKGGKGSGLGLSICQGIVRSHGGEIDVGNAAGGGTVVTLTLPLPVTAPSDRMPVASRVRADA
jgi:two-component system, NtrC family, sensor kinase